ncbi:hypothetical protein CRENPOLYSF2_160013 [Crenothrix polyspora]|uniref:Uncharacterized protein n=1 Tax=Crenothrix polyspora TaxID=360316 RepID=A0A1R4H255_9GAMM|nr:hypothetical protein CRENPOLYSF2_160013 [Crenothrix polyspora]
MILKMLTFVSRGIRALAVNSVVFRTFYKKIDSNASINYSVFQFFTTIRLCPH